MATSPPVTPAGVQGRRHRRRHHRPSSQLARHSANADDAGTAAHTRKPGESQQSFKHVQFIQENHSAAAVNSQGARQVNTDSWVRTIHRQYAVPPSPTARHPSKPARTAHKLNPETAYRAATPHHHSTH